MKYTLLILLFFSYSSVLASEIKIPLFNATSDAFSGVLEVNLTIDSNSKATGFIYALNNEETPVSLVALPTGIVLFKMSGKNVATLSSKNFNPEQGGPLTLTYLHNGLQDSYQNFNFALARQGQNWDAYVTESNGIPRNFISMFLKAYKLFGKVVGIDRITVK
jgi:hypothetical protein